MKRGWWWQRIHPVLRVFLAVAYFGSAFAFIAFAASQVTQGIDHPRQESAPVGSQIESTTTFDTDPTGSELYAANCSSCHGSSLEGLSGPELAAGSEAADLSDRRYESRISDGKGDMPGFSDRLTTDEIGEIVAYVRDQQGG